MAVGLLWSDRRRPRDSFSISIIDLGTFKLGPAVAFIGDRNARNYEELYGLASVGVRGFGQAFEISRDMKNSKHVTGNSPVPEHKEGGGTAAQ